MHPRLGSATLSQLAFSEEGNSNFPWEKSHWDNTVVKSKKERRKTKDILKLLIERRNSEPTRLAPLVYDVIVEQVRWREMDVETGLTTLRILLDVRRVAVGRVGVVNDHLQRKWIHAAAVSDRREGKNERES